MNGIYFFLLRSALVIGILLSWYWLALRNKRLHNYNRFYLLFTLCAGITIPLLHFRWFTIGPAAVTPVPRALGLLQSISDNGNLEQQTAGSAAMQTINWDLIILSVASLVSLLLLAILIARIVGIMRLVRTGAKTSVDGITVICADTRNAPFSFLRYMFWRDSIPLESADGRAIFRHELTHIRQKHTYDKLACQLLTCIFWFNPFYWIIQKELDMLHEFIADEHAISGNDTEAFAKMLLLAHNDGKYLIPQHRFFSSPIKRRIIMLQTTTETRFALLRQLLLLPLIAAAVIMFSFTPRKSPIVARAEKTILLVIDAGHGGYDVGGQYEGIKEKDLNLKVANKLKELAPGYNIDARLTRSGDENATLAQRVEFSNNLHADNFISVHVNDVVTRENTPAASPDNESSFVLIYSDSTQNPSNRKFSESVMLSLVKINGIHIGNLKPRTGLYVLKHSNAPNMLIELGDIKNKENIARLTDDAKLTELCSAILKGVVDAHKG